MTDSHAAAEPLWDLVEESLDEATFLWKRWEAELQSLTRNLNDVRMWTEDRLQGALDGVRVAGDNMAERIVAPALTRDDPTLWAVCAHLLAARAPDNARELLAATIRESKGPRLAQLVRGIEVAELNGSFAPVTRALLGADEEHKAALVRVKSFRRAAPGRELPELLRSADATPLIETLRAAAHVPDDSLNSAVVAAMRHDEMPVRLAAIECGIRRRLPDAWSAACELSRARRPESGRYLAALAMLGNSEEQELVFGALREALLRSEALHALGYIGTRRAAETCIAGMREPKLARIAGEAYCAITGADLERDGLAASLSDDAPPVAFEADDLDANLVPKPDELWPEPDVEAVRRHWDRAKTGYSADARYVRGQPASLGALMGAVEDGPMLRRSDYTLELTVRTGGKYDVETRAFSHAQRRMMSAARAASVATR